MATSRGNGLDGGKGEFRGNGDVGNGGKTELMCVVGSPDEQTTSWR